jgi:hypothetical protein
VFVVLFYFKEKKMPAYDTSGEGVVTQTYQNAVELSTDTEVIAQLSRDNHALNVTLTKLSESFDTLHRILARLEKDKKDMVPKHVLMALIRHAVSSGKIPFPAGFTGCMVDVNSYIKSTDIGVDANVSFSNGEKTITLLFEFAPLPANCKENEDYYPAFCIGNSRSPRVKKTAKKKEGTVTSTKNPFPPTGNPS